jgi:hypothetical protein
MNRLLHRLDKLWFMKTPPASLAILRILVGTYALLYLASRQSMLVRIAATDEALFAPVGLASLLDAPLGSAIFDSLLSLTMIAGAAFVLGWGFRGSGPVFSLLLLFVLCYRNSWSMIYHTDNLLVLHVLILGFARSADALSVDALVRWRYREVSDRCRYGWPIQLVCAVTALSYFLAGVAKVAGPLGWLWASGASLQGQVAIDALRKELLVGEASPLVGTLYEHVWLFTIIGVSTLVLELGAPAAIFSQQIARRWAVAMFAFHWGIFLIMGIRFEYPLTGVAFASFHVREALLRARPSLAAAIRASCEPV